MNLKSVTAIVLSTSFSLTSFCLNAQIRDSTKAGTILFADDFSGDAIGKFPSSWISNRPGEVVAPKNFAGRWFKMHAEGTYLPKLLQNIPSSFSIDFDIVHQAAGSGNNTTELTIFDKSKDALNDALFPGTNGIKIVFETFIVSCLCYSNLEPNKQITTEFRGKVLQTNNITKISIKVQDQLLQVFVNGTECLHVPQCKGNAEVFNAVRFYLWGSQAEPLIRNFSIRQIL